MAFLTKRLQDNWGSEGRIPLQFSSEEIEWMVGKFAKICLQVETEEELRKLHQQATDLGLTSSLIEDSGKTEFNGVVTATAVAIGPHDAKKIDAITGHLKLY